MSFQDIVPKHIQAIAPYKSENPAEELERELGVEVVQLGMNENPFGPSPRAVEAVRQYLQKIAPYPDDSGFHLRQKLAASLKISSSIASTPRSMNSWKRAAKTLWH